MNQTGIRNSYLIELRRSLEGHRYRLSQVEIEEIIRRTDEAFRSGTKAEKLEGEIAESLGPARQLAEGYVARSLLKNEASESSISAGSLVLFRVMRVVFILAPLNFLMMLGPFLVLVAIIFGGWISSIGLTVMAFLACAQTAAMSALMSGPLGFSIIFFCLGCLAIGILLGLGMMKLTSLFYRLIWNWIRWNINFVMVS